MRLTHFQYQAGYVACVGMVGGDTALPHLAMVMARQAVNDL